MVATQTRAQTEAPFAVKLLPKQDDFLFAPEKYAAYIGGVGSGKTLAGCVKAIMKCRPGQDGMIVTPTYPMMRDVTQKELFDLLDKAGISYQFLKGEEKAVINGATVLFRSADAPDRLRGPNLNWAYLDEGALMREMVWKIVLGRLRVGTPSAWVTGTPAGYNWLWEYWVETTRRGYRMFTASTRENRFLPDEYVEDLLDNYTGEFARQEIDGEFVAFEGLVYTEFIRGIHVVDPFEIPEDWQRVRAIDYGYTNPLVCLWGALDEDGRLYIYDEHYQRKALIGEHAAAILARNGDYAWTVADHDAQDNAEMRACGVATVNAQKSVQTGIQKVKARLVPQADTRPRLVVTSACVNTIKEFGMYRWSEQAGRVKEEPVKEADHAMDALRYMVMEMEFPQVPMISYVEM